MPLSKEFDTEVVTTQQYVSGSPAIPAYCATTQQSSCQYERNPAISYHYEIVNSYTCYQDGIPETCYEWGYVAYYNGEVGTNGIINGVEAYGYECTSRPVTTCYPAKPAVPATPVTVSRSVLNKIKRPGWTNGRARSLSAINIGQAGTFTVSRGSRGVFLGLASGDAAWHDRAPEAFTHGVMFDDTGIRVYESGEFKATLATSWDTATAVSITRKWGDGYISYAAGGTSYTSEATATGDLYTYAALYESGDSIETAEYAATSLAQSTDYAAASLAAMLARGAEAGHEDECYAAFQPMTAWAWTEDYERCEASFQPMTAAGVGNDDVLSTSFNPFACFGTEHLDYMEVRASFQPMTAQGYGESYVPPQQDFGFALFAPMTALGYDFTGEPVMINVSLQPFEARGYEDPEYSEVSASFSPFIAYGEEDVRPDRIMMSSSLLATTSTSLKASLVLVFDTSMTLANAFTMNRTAAMQLVTALYGSSSIAMTGHFNAAFMTDVTAQSAQYFSPLNEVAEVLVVNVDSGAVTRYENYGFREFYELDGQYYGVGNDGVYLLDGDDDEGQAIDASIDLGTQDFGTLLRKSIRAIYASATTEGTLLLRVSVDGGEEYTYESRQDGRVQRVTPGRGLIGTDWHLVLENKDGQDFNMWTIEAVMEAANRRIQ